MPDNNNIIICRLCLKPPYIAVDIFRPHGRRGLLFWKIINEMLQLGVFENDGLPGNICDDCTEKLTEFSDFKSTCTNSKTKLMKLLPEKELMIPIKQEVIGSEGETELNGENDSSLELRSLSSFIEEESIRIDLSEVTIKTETVDLGQDELFDAGNDHLSEPRASEGCVEEGGTHTRELPIKIAGMKTDEESGDAVSGKSGQLYLNDSVCGIPQVSPRISDRAQPKQEFKGFLQDVRESPAIKEESERNMPCLLKAHSYDSVPNDSGNLMSESQTLRTVHPSILLSEGIRHIPETPGATDCNILEEQMVKSKWKLKDCYVAMYDIFRGVPGIEVSDTMSCIVVEGSIDSEEMLEDLYRRCQVDDYLLDDSSEVSTENAHWDSGNQMSDDSAVSRVTESQQRTNYNAGNGTPFTCCGCLEQLEDRTSLLNHLFEKHTNMNHRETARCLLCGNVYSNRYSLKTHMATHIDDGQLDCDICGRRYSQKCHLYRHQALHVGYQLHHRDEHGKEFPQNYSMSHHLNAPRQFECTYCGKMFSRKDGLSVHEKIHTGLKPYSCSVCQKKFSRRHHLARHSNVHCRREVHQCQHCLKAFPKKRQLTGHSCVRKRFKCKSCSKRFTDSGRLKVHSLTHTNKRDFLCEHCGKKFSRKDHLVVHNRIHLNLRPYVCASCGKSFRDNSHLVRHINRCCGRRP